MISLMLSQRFMKTGISWYSKNDSGIKSKGFFITGSIYIGPVFFSILVGPIQWLLGG